MSPIKGVFSAKKKDGSTYYRASITYRGKHISLGSFSEPSSASRCYEEADSLLKSTDTISDYSASCMLSFDKWVCLVNFRDNGVYFKNPIYVQKNFFHYYLSASEIFTFDIDDLFFYSSHKIQKRGGHLFVNDYGMQLTIASRYGIHNFSVAGKDYLFQNGDDHDFRYSNILIINHYQGVIKRTVKGKDSYRAKIHINGDTIIGDYETEEQAAIAYNKAADLLIKAGFSKNYSLNYIDGMSGREYAEIYHQIKISNKIKERCRSFTDIRNPQS